MMQQTTNIEDLEDGEIESDGEEITEPRNEEKKDDQVPTGDDGCHEKVELEESFHGKSGKKKKSKSNKGEQKLKDKNKKHRKHDNPNDEDFAGNIEKAIKKAMNKNDDDNIHEQGDVDEPRKRKKRKRYDGRDGSGKKRKKQNYSDEMDESEMMCVRGASPVQKQSPGDDYQDDDKDSYASESSQESRGHTHNSRSQRQRPKQRGRKNNKNDGDRRRGSHPMQDPDGVCLYFMQGKCHKGDECMYSHNAHPPRKMELCKFYLMDCCAKRDKCLYMHADFPCKYYHTGLPCIYKEECKFAHGKPLTEGLKNILLKHIESAPKEILGDFPRLNREGALKMIHSTQLKLMQCISNENGENQDKNIPSLFDSPISRPQHVSESSPLGQYCGENNKISPKVRHSRWQNENLSNANNSNCYENSSPTVNVLSIKNLTGVLTPRQISDLTKMGIDNLDQLGQLTVLQLNSIGISLKQITEIQLNTMSIQKLGLINANAEQSQPLVASTVGAQDLDLRVAPGLPVVNTSVAVTESMGKDIDMRFQHTVTTSASENANLKLNEGAQVSKDMIDIDQYTKDALKFALKDEVNSESHNKIEKPNVQIIVAETKDVDHRVLSFPEAEVQPHMPKHDANERLEGDTDIRFLQPEPIYKSPAKRNRRSTTDDDDENNLLIDWYSSDEEKGHKKKSPKMSPQFMSPPRIPAPHVIEPSSVLSKIGDLSKIDISEEVTKLLNTMKNNMQETQVENKADNLDSNQRKDPRSKRSPDPKIEEKKLSTKKPPRISIYECIDGEPTDGRRRTDVDLRHTDYKLPAFGDTDLRQGTSGDIDFRLGIPFKPIPNYTPASEIDGSINSHPPIVFKVVPIDIPRPDYTDIRNSTAKSQALSDPRLRKVFRLSVDESNSDSEKSVKVSTTAPRVDPRRKQKDASESSSSDQKSSSLDLQLVIQNSDWYRELSSTQKIFVNQQIATVTAMVKQYHIEKNPMSKFDLAPIQGNTVLCSILTNLGITLGENGEFSYLPKPKEALLKTPVPYNQNNGLYSNMGPVDNMNRMNMQGGMGVGGVGHMNNMNMGNMGHGPGYNPQFSDPRGGPAPGLLGIAPNMPHNFNNKFPPNHNFGNMQFNGPGSEFGHMDSDQFPRFPGRGGPRGRGGERWNRGGGGRGNRKNFNDRGWNSDRQ